MINFDRDHFDEMTTKQKIAFVNDLVIKNTKLTQKEIEYLVPQNKEKYFYNRLKTSDWLEDYEFNELSDRDKEVYIWNIRFLQKADLERLPYNLKDIYISKTITSGVQLTPGEFELLDDDDLKRKYAKEKIKYAIDSTFTPEELAYLDADDQIRYLNTLDRMGLAPNPDELHVFKPKAMRFHMSRKTMNEVRQIIRQEVRKILS